MKKINRIYIFLLILTLLATACSFPTRIAPSTPSASPMEATSSPAETQVTAEALEELPPYYPSPAFRDDVAMSDFVYQRPDPNEYKDRVQRFLGDFGAAESPQEQLSLYLELEAYAMKISDQLLYAQMRYMADVNERTQAENDFASGFISEVIDCEMMVYQALLSSRFLPQMSTYLGENVLAEMHRAVRDYDPQITSLSEQARKCNSDYILTMKKHEERTILVDGKELKPSEVFSTLSGLSERDPKFAEYTEKYMIYFDELNRDCDEIFARLLAINTEIAKAAGYESYPDYKLDRGSYSLPEIEAFVGDVRSILVPVMTGLTEQGEALSGGALSSRLYLAAICPPYLMIDEIFYDPDDAPDVAEDKEYAAAKEILEKLLPTARNTVDYLERMEMMDILSSPEKSVGGFTAYFYGLSQPYIFMDHADVNTIIHETGHAMASLCLPQIDIPSRFAIGTEIAEVHSMGLEVLAQQYYDILYGESARYAVLASLFEGLYRTLTQTMYYEFELLCYENPSMTREERNALYARLTDEYGLSIPGFSLYGDSGLDWVTTPHHFESPLYTIDYALAQMVSFQLWEIQENDPELAMQYYLSFLVDSLNLDLRSRLADAGLADVFDSQNSRLIAERLAAVFESEEYTAPLAEYLKYMRIAA